MHPTFTFVQPSGFMSNALEWAASIEAEGVVRAPTGDGRIAFIHPNDIAAVATEALSTREFEGKSLPITGPEHLSHSEMTAKIGAAVGKPLRFQPITDEQERRHMIESGCPPEIVDARCGADRWALEPNKKSIPESWLEALRCIMEEHIPPHHLAVPDSDILDMAQLAPTTQLSELIELACRWNKSFGIDLGNVEIRVLIKEPQDVQCYSE